MAEEKHENGLTPVWILIGAIVLLFAIWWVSGGVERGTLRQLFMGPPPSPAIPTVPEPVYNE